MLSFDDYDWWIQPSPKGRLRLRIKTAEMSFLCRVTGLTLRHGARSSDIWRELRKELMLLHVRRSQLKRFLASVWSGCLLGTSLLRFSRQRPRRDPEHTGGIIHLLWPGRTSGSSSRSWKMLPGRGTSGLPCSVCMCCFTLAVIFSFFLSSWQRMMKISTALWEV